MGDLVERLRKHAHRSQRGSHNQSRWKLIMEAADEIEGLRAATKAVIDALEAICGDCVNHEHHSDHMLGLYVARNTAMDELSEIFYSSVKEMSDVDA